MGRDICMNSIIKELWYGNICPQADIGNDSREMKELMEYIARHHGDLLKTMNDKQKQLFEKFNDCREEYISLAEGAIFDYAFKLGARLSLEIQKDAE